MQKTTTVNALCVHNNILQESWIDVAAVSGIPDLKILGVSPSFARSSRQRILTAFKTSNIRIPRKKIVVDIRSDSKSISSGIDMAICAGILQLLSQHTSHYFFSGDITLKGDFIPSENSHLLNTFAYQTAKTIVISKAANQPHQDQIHTRSCSNLTMLKNIVETKQDRAHTQRQIEKTQLLESPYNHTLMRAIQIALAGLHPMLILGPDRDTEREEAWISQIFNTSPYLRNRQTFNFLKSGLSQKSLASTTQNRLVIAIDLPCLCGYSHIPEYCSCSHAQKNRYHHSKKYSLNRYQLLTHFSEQPNPLIAENALPRTIDIKSITQAHERQQKRSGIGKLNADLTSAEITQFVQLKESAKKKFKTAITRKKLTRSESLNILRIALTIKDLEGTSSQSEKIQPHHINEALFYLPRLTP